MDVVFGIHAVRQLIKHQRGLVKELWVQESRRDPRVQELLSDAKSAGIPVIYLGRADIDQRLAGKKHQGIAAVATEAPAVDESQLDALIDQHGQTLLLLILDSVQDPHNLGACLRTADAAGVHAVIAPKDRACGRTAVVRKVACGAAETVPFIQVTNLRRTLSHLKERGVWLAGACGEAEKALYNVDFKGPFAVVLGAEDKGMRRMTRDACDYLVRIPMSGAVESLNVSVACGVCLYEVRRQREQT